MRDRTLGGTFAVAIVAIVGHVFMAVNVGVPYAVPATIVGLVAGAVVLRGPVGQALARRIQGDTAADLPAETVIGELEDLRARLGELEERVDFSERLLTKEGRVDG